MNQYSQADKRWAQIKIDHSTNSIGGYGCFITCLGMLVSITPDQVNVILTNGGGLTSGGLVISDKSAQLLGLNYAGKTGTYQSSICIAETDHFQATAHTQHFVVWLGDGNIIDPLDGKLKKNIYNIVSYRLFSKPNQGVGMKVTVGVTVQAMVDTIGYDQPGAGHEKQNIQKGQLGEITEVHDDNWCVVDFAGAYRYWVMQKDFEAVPRSQVPSDSDSKLAQAKDLAKQGQAISSKILAL